MGAERILAAHAGSHPTVPRVKITLVHLPKNPNSRADVAATWHSLLVTMASPLLRQFGNGGVHSGNAAKNEYTTTYT
eukprot:1178652-Prorocentrum_minimum.AAC.1